MSPNIAFFLHFLMFWIPILFNKRIFQIVSLFCVAGEARVQDQLGRDRGLRLSGARPGQDPSWLGMLWPRLASVCPSLVWGRAETALWLAHCWESGILWNYLHFGQHKAANQTNKIFPSVRRKMNYIRYYYILQMS